ncbi:hypothetical protein ABT095_14700 [Kitasatospora sp. NPDC002227]|uniref:hypothetical protein n=1 Tax=Kitasatospora sp. NPDC002227 TaxID=3154773 RepID=UPI00332014FF
MPRHELKPLPEAEHFAIAIGWDGPLATFYAQVLDSAAEEEDQEVLWEGTEPYQYPEPHPLIELLRRYAEIPDGLADDLKGDAASAGDAFPGRAATAFVAEHSLPRGTDPAQALKLFQVLDRER